MAVKCPKHNIDLEIEYTSINMYGSKNPVVTGQCPKCKIKYLSREIMSSSGSFKIGGQTYEYLNDMEKAYPYPFEPISPQEKSKPTSNEGSTSEVISPNSHIVVKNEPAAQRKNNKKSKTRRSGKRK